MIYRLKAASLLLNGDIDDEIVRVLLKGESMIVWYYFSLLVARCLVDYP